PVSVITYGPILIVSTTGWMLTMDRIANSMDRRHIPSLTRSSELMVVRIVDDPRGRHRGTYGRYRAFASVMASRASVTAYTLRHGAVMALYCVDKIDCHLDRVLADSDCQLTHGGNRSLSRARA